jgi:hypothetical protein
MATMMVLDSYEFTLNPEECDMPVPENRAELTKTLGGMAYFSWGAFIEGSVLELKWTYMAVSMFDSLQTKMEAGAEVVFAPGNGSSYNVMIKSLKGKWFLDQTVAAQFRGNVTMELAIISEVT